MIIIPGRISASGNPLASALIVINLLSLIAVAIGYFYSIEILMLLGTLYLIITNFVAIVVWLICFVNKIFFGGE